MLCQGVSLSLREEDIGQETGALSRRVSLSEGRGHRAGDRCFVKACLSLSEKILDIFYDQIMHSNKTLICSDSHVALSLSPPSLFPSLSIFYLSDTLYGSLRAEGEGERGRKGEIERKGDREKGRQRERGKERERGRVGEREREGERGRERGREGERGTLKRLGSWRLRGALGCRCPGTSSLTP